MYNFTIISKRNQAQQKIYLIIEKIAFPENRAQKLPRQKSPRQNFAAPKNCRAQNFTPINSNIGIKSKRYLNEIVRYFVPRCGYSDCFNQVNHSVKYFLRYFCNALQRLGIAALPHKSRRNAENRREKIDAAAKKSVQNQKLGTPPWKKLTPPWKKLRVPPREKFTPPREKFKPRPTKIRAASVEKVQTRSNPYLDDAIALRRFALNRILKCTFALRFMLP